MKSIIVLVVGIVLVFSLCHAYAAQTPQEWWSKTVHDVFEGKQDGIAYTISLWEEKNLKVDLVGKSMVSTVSIEVGPWPKAVICVEGMGGQPVMLAPGSWMEEYPYPLVLVSQGVILAMARPEYALEIIASYGSEGFDYGVYKGTVEDFWRDIVKPIVSKYNELPEVDPAGPELVPEFSV